MRMRYTPGVGGKTSTTRRTRSTSRPASSFKGCDAMRRDGGSPHQPPCLERLGIGPAYQGSPGRSTCVRWPRNVDDFRAKRRNNLQREGKAEGASVDAVDEHLLVDANAKRAQSACELLVRHALVLAKVLDEGF